jgi:hypothetical protein
MIEIHVWWRDCGCDGRRLVDLKTGAVLALSGRSCPNCSKLALEGLNDAQTTLDLDNGFAQRKTQGEGGDSADLNSNYGAF